MRCCGMAIATILSSMPRSRKTSTVRWLVMWARGEFAVPLYLVMATVCTLCRASKAAAVKPAGPAPTTRTSVSIVFMVLCLPWCACSWPAAISCACVSSFTIILYVCAVYSPPLRKPREPSGQETEPMIEERDLIVTMRDGTRLALDVYRPDKPGKYPVLYACALHNKDIQGPDIADLLPPQPAHAPLWFGPIEAGDTRRFIANGYVHVVAQPRGSAKSEGHYGHEDTDHYDLIEWI